jgi:DNA polymerase III alpha subunit
MTTLRGRKINEYGDVIFNEDGLTELLYSGRPISGMVCDQDIAEQFNNQSYAADLSEMLTSLEEHRESVQDHDLRIQSNWLVPEAFMKMDICALILGFCETDIERERVELELKMYEERDLIDVLRVMAFLVAIMRKHKIVWGVGRGSSVASYCLYLLGVHRVDSVKYQLDIHEFLK